MDQWGVHFFKSMFLKYFHLIVHLVVHLVAVKNVINACLLGRVLHCLFYWLIFLIIHLICSSTIGVLSKTNIIYQFKCLLGDCIMANNKYNALTSTILSRRLTMHLSDTTSIAQHLKIYSWLTTEFWKILTKNTILQQQNNK